MPGDKDQDKDQASGARPVQGTSTHFIYKEARVMMALADDGGEVAWYGGTVCQYDASAKGWLIAYDDGDFKVLTEDEISTQTRNGELKPMAKDLGGLVDNERQDEMVEQIIFSRSGRASPVVAGIVIGRTQFKVADIRLFMSFHLHSGQPLNSNPTPTTTPPQTSPPSRGAFK